MFGVVGVAFLRFLGGVGCYICKTNRSPSPLRLSRLLRFWIWWCFEAVVVGDEGVGRGVGGVVWCGVVWWCVVVWCVVVWCVVWCVWCMWCGFEKQGREG